jgi:hypothetical protein
MADEHELVAALRRLLQELRADPATPPAARAAAYEQWFREAVREGQQPDAFPTVCVEDDETYEPVTMG